MGSKESREKLTAIRAEIDVTDAEIIALFGRRMRLSEDVARVKSEGNIAVIDRDREEAVLKRAAELSDSADKSETIALSRSLIALSRLRQFNALGLTAAIEFPPPAPAKAEGVTVAFQGVGGAWSQHACDTLYPGASLKQFDYFDDVFAAVKSGEADYGVVPIENSQTGAIGEVYNLLRQRSCYVVGETWVPVSHCLLGLPNASIGGITEVLSHPEGFNQCRKFLKNRPWALTACQNTALAAKTVRDRRDRSAAAIGSRKAAENYGLTVLAPDITDARNNRTRFIAIADAPEYTDGSDAVSVTFSVQHKAGALCAVLQCFMLADVNLTRIESRPLSGERYRFFADLEANIEDPAALSAIRQAAMHCDYFEVLGCYTKAKQSS
ncbi:MAG: chorismate mutase [Clostridiales bacterium]|jgi:chorismate mutase/prephenate dehydratase|nr:chorismate mutase [Clostridiales bacterium]